MLYLPKEDLRTNQLKTEIKVTTYLFFVGKGHRHIQKLHFQTFFLLWFYYVYWPNNNIYIYVYALGDPIELSGEKGNFKNSGCCY